MQRLRSTSLHLWQLLPGCPRHCKGPVKGFPGLSQLVGALVLSTIVILHQWWHHGPTFCVEVIAASQQPWAQCVVIAASQPLATTAAVGSQAGSTCGCELLLLLQIGHRQNNSLAKCWPTQPAVLLLSQQCQSQTGCRSAIVGHCQWQSHGGRMQ